MRLFNIPLPKKAQLGDERTIQIDGSWDVTGAPDAVTAAIWNSYMPVSVTGEKHFALTLDEKLQAEAYRMTLTEDGVKVAAGSSAGLRSAAFTAYQMMADDRLPAGEIVDYPMIPQMRGFHLNVSNMRKMDMPMLCQMLRWIAEAKLNTVMIEYGSRFPLTLFRDSRSPNALSEEDVLTLNRTARELGLDVIPHLQTCGHLEYLLKNPACEAIREVKDKPQQLCPRNPASVSFIKTLLDEYIALHPGLKYLHIGGDETRQLGFCPDCREFVEKYGVGRLYSEFMNQIIDYVCSKGLVPMIYDDMICAHPDALDGLDRRAVIVYWDYWATVPKTPHLLARYGNVFVCDKRWKDGTWTAELEDVEAGVLNFFVHKAVDDVVETLGPDYMARYGAYLGDEVPKRFKAYPYIEYYMDQGFRVVGMPTTLGNTDNYLGMPNQARFTSNIRVCSERIARAGALGVITSAWYLFPSPLFPIGISTTGQYTWGLPAAAPSSPDWKNRW